MSELQKRRVLTLERRQRRAKINTFLNRVLAIAFIFALWYLAISYALTLLNK